MNQLEVAESWIAEAEFILITAGSGLTAAAGFNYADKALFAREFPGMLQYGFRAQYQLIGFDDWDADLQWGYWAAHVNLVRFGSDHSDVYIALRQIVELKGWANVFVLTSNVDALFGRNGFDSEHIYTPQGDYALLQCTSPCWRQVWPWKDQIDRIIASTDAKTQRLSDNDLVPRCPNCGEDVFPNVRIDDSFVHDHFDPAAERLQGWVANARRGRGLVVEIGAGFNTPSVVRWPGERLVDATEDWRLIRINSDHAAVPEHLTDRAMGIRGDAKSTIISLRDFARKENG